MARKGKNRTGSKQNNPYGYNKPKVIAPPPVLVDSVARKAIDTAHHKTFFSEGHEWPGLQIEYPPLPSGFYTEINYYMDELEDKVLYEETVRKMLKDLKANGDLDWYELIKEPVPWPDDDDEYLRLRAK